MAFTTGSLSFHILGHNLQLTFSLLLVVFWLLKSDSPVRKSAPLWFSLGSAFLVPSLSCVRLCTPMDCSAPGFPVLHYLPELAHTRVHWVGDAIQPSHPLSAPSPLALNLSQHQGLFQWVGSLHQVAKVLESFSFSSSNEYSGLISFRNP